MKGLIERLAQEGIKAKLEKTDKGNGVIFNGVRILTDDKVSPYIYYRDGEDIDAIVERAKRVMEQEMPEIDVSFMEDYDKVKERLALMLLEIVPDGIVGVPVLGGHLMAVPIIIVTEEGTCKVTKAMIEHWNVTEEQIYEDALVSAKKNRPAEFSPLGAIFGLNALSNREGVNGASAILYAEDLPYEDFFMIPSSRHEVILMPYTEERDAGELSQMVKDVNKTLAPEDVLSDNLFIYHNGEWSAV